MNSKTRTVAIPLPHYGFDPSECGIPWKILSQAGIGIVFGTPDGKQAQCDERMLTGKGLGIFSPMLRADKNARQAYSEMANSSEFQAPTNWANLSVDDFDGILLPGGHDKAMREYLESPVLQNLTAHFFESNKPVAAICHGVVLACRSQSQGKSVLFGRKTTALLASQELLAWSLTCLRLGSYYRTYPQTVEDEVKRSLQSPHDFAKGPLPLFRDNPRNLQRGFTVVDGNYVSARWPGDVHKFATTFVKVLE